MDRFYFPILIYLFLAIAFLLKATSLPFINLIVMLIFPILVVMIVFKVIIPVMEKGVGKL